MGTLASVSQLINRITGGNSGTPENILPWKDARVAGAAAATPIAGRITSLWQYEGSPSHGGVPGAVAAPSNTTAGALKQTNPGGGRQKYLLGGSGWSGATGTIIVYDRVLHISGFAGNNVGVQTVGGSLTRYTDGIGNQVWIEIYTQIGASSTTITASYSNTVPTAGRITRAEAIGNTGLREAQRIIIPALQAGDLGVSAVASVTLNATTGTAGDFGVTVSHPLLELPVGILGNTPFRDTIAQLPPLPETPTGACLALAFLPNATTAIQLLGSLHFVEV